MMLMHYFINQVYSTVWKCLANEPDPRIGAQYDSVDLSECKNSLITVNFEVNSQIKTLYGFDNMHKLEIVDLQNCNSLETIDNECFMECSTLNTINFPVTLLSIGTDAFYYCKALKSVDLSICSNLTTIGVSAFYMTMLLSEIKFPKSLKYLKREALRSTGLLTLVDLSMTHIETMDAGVFAWGKFSEIRFPFTLKAFLFESFYGAQIENLNLSDLINLETIGKSVFASSKLTSILLPPSLLEIHEDAFSLCRFSSPIFILPKGIRYLSGKFSSIYISEFKFDENDPSEPKYCQIEDGILFNYDKTVLISYPPNLTTFQVYPVFENVTELGNLSFYQSQIPSITLDVFSKLKMIGSQAFINSKIVQITFPPTLRSILSGAFNGLSIQEFNFSQCKLEYMGVEAFTSSQVETVIFPLTTKLTIDRSAFQYSQIKGALFKMPELVIGELAFATSTFQTVIFQNEKVTLGQYAFESSNLSGTFVVPKSMAQIGYSAFYDTTIDAFEVEQGNTLFSADNGVLFNYEKTKIVQVPPKLPSFVFDSDLIFTIGEYAFAYIITHHISLENCRKLKTIEKCAFTWVDLDTITLPSNLEIIGDGAFEAASIQLNSTFIIPKSVTTIGKNPWFKMWPDISELLVEEGSTSFKAFGLYLTNFDVTEVILHWGTEYDNTPSFMVLETTNNEWMKTIESFKEYSFSHMWHSLDLELFTSLKIIKSHAFFVAAILIPQLTIIPNSVVEIGDSAFEMSYIELEAGILPYFYIPASVEKIGKLAFCNLEMMPKFNVSSGSQTLSSTENGVLFNFNKTKLINFPTYSTEREYQVLDTTEIIGSHAFSSTRLHVIDMSKCPNLRIFEDYAFAYANAYTIILPESLEKIGDYAFTNTLELKPTMNIPKNVQFIGNNPWVDSPITEFVVDPESQNFTVINSVLIAKDESVIIASPISNSKSFIGTKKTKEIREKAFYGCYNMKTIDLSLTLIKKLLPSTFYQVKSNIVKLPCYVETIGEYCFYESMISTLVIPAFVKTIGEFAFSNSNQLKYLEISGDSIEINDCAFSGSWYLEFFVINSKSVKVNGENLFFGCNLLCGVAAENETKAELINGGISQIAFDRCEAQYNHPDYSEEVYFCPPNPITNEFSNFEVENPYLEDIVRMILYSWSIAVLE